jgi:GYF domain 2
MDLFICVDGQQRGPFPLKSLHDMRSLGTLSAGALVWSPETNSWTDLDNYLLQHPLATLESSTLANPRPGKKKIPRGPSILLGLLGALGVAVVAGGVIAGVGILTGAFLPFLWWAMAWGSGTAAKACGRTSGWLMGLLSFAATLLGIFISCTCLESHPVIILSGIGMLISFAGSLWFAFRTGSTENPGW